MDLAISEQLAYSTARVESTDAQGKIATGTAFFFRCLDTGQSHVPVLVTNKHVVEGGVRGRFHLTLRDDAGALRPASHVPLELDRFAHRWIPHPDSDVDLAVMPIAPLLKECRTQGLEFFFLSLDAMLLPSADELADLGALEDVVMIGYPDGIWDSVNNMPIFRRGITATHPNLNYNGNQEFMIDIACFPGSSGSPVFLYNGGGYSTRSGNVVLGTTRVKLLGVLYAGFQHSVTGEVQVVDIPTSQRAHSVSNIPNNLGLVIKSERLREFDAVLAPLNR